MRCVTHFRPKGTDNHNDDDDGNNDGVTSMKPPTPCGHSSPH